MDINKFTLAFKNKMLDREFKESFNKDSLKIIQIAFIVGAFFYLLFGSLDILLFPEIKNYFWKIRLYFAIPITLFGLFFVTYFKKGYKYTQFITSIVVICAAAGILQMMHIGKDQPGISAYYAGIALCIIFGFTVFRLRFIWATVVGLFIMVMYLFAEIYLLEQQTKQIISNYFFMISFQSAGMMIGYFMEYQWRKEFILRKQMKESERKEIIKLKESNKQKTNFFQNISHELRTPLTLIMSPIEEACHKYKDDLLDVALKNSKRLYRLVNQLLDFQKLTSAKKELKLTPINLNRFISSVSEYFRTIGETKDFTFNTQISSNSEIHILAEIDALEKIVFNFLSNAIKYAGKKGAISLLLNETEDNKIRISVRDNGLGITKQNQEKLFKIFSQIDGSASREFEGTGLGLALVKELSDKLNGEIGVDSSRGLGTTFFVEFPIYKKEKRKIDVLILDDDLQILQVLADTLLLQDIESSPCSTTEMAREILENVDVKCIVSDLNMPNEDGISFLKYMKDFQPNTKRILMTGNGNAENISNAMNVAKVHSVILKPIDNMKFVDIVKSLLNEYGQTSNESVIDILFVDDDTEILNQIESIVTGKHPELKYRTSNSAASAKKILIDTKVKCVVSDYNMPKETGVSLLKFVYQTVPNTSRFLVTGEDTSTIPKEAVTEAHIHEILDKPYDEAKLNKIVEYVKQSPIIDTEREASNDLDNYKPKEWLLADALDTDESDDNDEIQGDGELILVVDDLKDMRKLISKALKKSNFKIITAKDGKEGFEKAEQFKPDLIITDWMMPVESGIELTENLKNNPELASIPTILLTAKSDEESQLIGTQKGSNAYIGKPFDNLELISTVNNLLNLKKREKEVDQLNQELSENVLKRFLPPTIVDGIISGKKILDQNYINENITVMFTDLCAFSSLSTDIGPQQMARMLNTYLNVMTQTIFDHGGTIDKIMGDAIMAIWGAPEKLNQEKQVEQAYLCSLELNKKLIELNKTWANENLPQFKKRIGIHHGPAVVGYFGGSKRSDYTAIGNTVNKAQRIESVACPGEIYVSNTIRDMLPDDAKWEKAGMFELKGVSGKDTLFKILL